MTPTVIVAAGIWAIGLMVLASCGNAQFGSGESVSSVGDSRLVEDRWRIERSADERLGDGFACAVVVRRTSSRPGRLIVYVTTREAAEGARALVAELESSRQTIVKRTSPRLARPTMMAIRKEIEDALPSHPTSAVIGMESPVDRSDCPRVRIQILPPGRAGTAMERWAESAVRRFGRDRVVVSRFGGATLD